MTDEEKNALKAACLQAAATLRAAANPATSTRALDVAECAKLAPLKSLEALRGGRVAPSRAAYGRLSPWRL
jgi:hypothetical protein